VGADGTDVRGGGAHYDMSAVAALPYLNLTLGKDGGGLNVLEQGAVALLVLLLYGAHHTELGGQLREAFSFRGLGEALVHIGPLIVLAIGSGSEVLGGVSYAVELLEPEFGVLLLVVSGLEEDGCYLLKSVLLGL